MSESSRILVELVEAQESALQTANELLTVKDELISLLLIALSLESCASRCGQQRRYWSKHRAV